MSFDVTEITDNFVSQNTTKSMKLYIILSALILVVCVTDLQAWWSRRSSSSSGTRISSRTSWFRTSRSGSSRRGWIRTSRSGSSRRFSYDLNKKGTTNLYNSKVTKVESYSRPLNSWVGNLGIKHTGVVATTSNGHRWLIHKGNGYGKSSSTIITDAKYMSNRWKKTGTKYTKGHTISDLMKAGYVNKPFGFSSGKKICWDASRNIMNRVGKRGC